MANDRHAIEIKKREEDCIRKRERRERIRTLDKKLINEGSLKDINSKEKRRSKETRRIIRMPPQNKERRKKRRRKKHG